MSRPRVLPLLLLIVSGCASGASRERLELGAWSPPGTQRCQFGESVVPLGVLMDTIAAAAAARSFGSPGAVLFSTATDSLGRTTRFRVIESTLPPDDADTLRERLAATLQESEQNPNARARILLQLEEDGPRFRSGATQTCRPVLINRDSMQRYLMMAMQGAPAAGEIGVRMYVETDGRVTQVEVDRRRGDPLVATISTMLASTARFHPAVIDREPVPVWVALTFSSSYADRRR